jgi:hypothetical protein
VKTAKVPLPLRRWDFCLVSRPGSFAKNQGCPSSVLLDVLLDAGCVLLDKMRVVGFLRCRSLTRKFVP